MEKLLFLLFFEDVFEWAYDYVCEETTEFVEETIIKSVLIVKEVVSDCVESIEENITLYVEVEGYAAPASLAVRIKTEAIGVTIVTDLTKTSDNIMMRLQKRRQAIIQYVTTLVNWTKITIAALAASVIFRNMIMKTKLKHSFVYTFIIFTVISLVGNAFFK